MLVTDSGMGAITSVTPLPGMLNGRVEMICSILVPLFHDSVTDLTGS